MQTTYEDRKIARKERLEARAERARLNSDSAYRAGRRAVEDIPMGQPILVGHHSEGRHRAALKRYDSGMRKSIEEDKKAEHYARKAAAVGTGGISSDDPEALQKLRDELANLNRAHDTMKQANVIIRGRTRNIEEKTAALVELGFAPEDAANMQNPNSIRGVGFPSYVFSNNKNNMRRVELRIKELEALSEREPVEAQGVGYVYREDIEDNRVWFLFEQKPDEVTRKRLRSEGFVWSPSREGKPWVRKLSRNAINAGKSMRIWLDERVKESSQDSQL